LLDLMRRIRSAVLRWANLRPPRGHMEMLREEMTRHEDERVAKDARATEKRQAAKDADSRADTTPGPPE
jgi:hypothetical protein